MSERRISLVSVYAVKEAPAVLYRLLAERESRVNISHKKLPSMARHLAFVRSKPYKAWYLLKERSGGFAGAVYLSKNDEIGLFIFKALRGRGYGREALAALLAKHRGVKRFLANVSPRNPDSIRFFTQQKFRHIQNTYELTREKSK
ncbi:MAG TPA: GNAT family N-acetyltransferase [Candidatus Eisenbacteria bacterium]|jgi:RimJ/RimL family protein N-acetyltransferase|nr:GNAT family N-acetyltransferase [Candidatus Eisenbacteria bacterium]